MGVGGTGIVHRVRGNGWRYPACCVEKSCARRTDASGTDELVLAGFHTRSPR